MKKRNTFLLLTITVVSLMMNSCKRSEEIPRTPAFEEDEISYVAPTLETYHNYIELFDDKGVIYQIGDPYVLRWNGKYYLYSSNTGTNTTNGIPCWVSSNMIDWEFCSWVIGDGNPGSGGEYTKVAYAPEVVYYNGYFYLVEAPNGQGHYIFKCETPYGKFEMCSENLGMGLDGSLYVENDRLYLLSAVPGYSDGTISYTLLTVHENGTVTAGIRTGISQANLNGWTEGPGQFERNGYRYLTYTGNHVNASSYRVAYSYTSNKSLFKGLTTNDNNIILLSTGDDEPYLYTGGYNSDETAVPLNNYRGLGHSTNVGGPNLDSEFIVYHNAGRIDYNNQPGSGFNRRYNVAQLFNDKRNLTVNGLCNYETYKPFMADFSLENEGDLLTEVGNFSLTNKETDDIYTVEANLILSADNGKVVTSYVDDNNYSYVLVEDTSLKVIKKVNGIEEVLDSTTILVSENKTTYHTLKIVNGVNKATIYYDNQRKIVCPSLGKAGKVGVSKTNEHGQIEFSNDAYGTSDFEAIKNHNSIFPAHTYLKEEKRGFNIKNAIVNSDGVRQNEKENIIDHDEETLVKLERNDWVKYAINTPSTGLYNLYLKVNSLSQDSNLRVVIDDKDVYELKIGKATFTDNNLLMINAGQFEVKSTGIHSLKIICDSNNLEFSQVQTQKSQGIADFSNVLDSSFVEGNAIIGSVQFSDNGLSTKSSEPETMVYFGDKGNTNFKLKVDVTLVSGDAGIVFRTKNYSYTTGLSTENHAFQGYYLFLGTNGALNLYKYNYRIDNLHLGVPQVNGQKLIAMGNSVTVEIEANNNNFKVYLNGNEYINCYDPYPFVDGYCGFYTKATQIYYKNLTYINI